MGETSIPTRSGETSHGGAVGELLEDESGIRQNSGEASPRPVRVLLCTDYLPPSDGGVEQVVGKLAHALNDRGLDVGVFTLRARDDRIDLADHPDVPVFASSKTDLTEYVGLQSAVSVPAVWDFARVVSRFDPDVVHVHNRFFYTSYLGLLYKPLKKYPLVTTMHLGDLDYIDGVGGVAARAFQSLFAERLVRRSDAVICVSDSVEAVARSLGSRQTTTVPNAVDLNRFSVSKSTFDKTLLYVGRLVRNNGPQDLLRAIPDVLRAHPDAHLHVVGEGNLESDLRALAETLSVSESVTVHGFVDDILPLYEAADIFCRPSYSEGLPLTLLESMATYSVPVVTPVAGAREVLSDGETGHFVEVGNPTSISTTLNELLDDPDDVARLAEAARAYVSSRHDWDQRTTNVVQIYDEVSSHG